MHQQETVKEIPKKINKYMKPISGKESVIQQLLSRHLRQKVASSACSSEETIFLGSM